MCFLIQELDRLLPVNYGDISKFKKASESSKSLKFLWIGHASCLVEIDNVRVLFDPVFSERASFSQHFGPKRFRPVPCGVTDLPEVNVVAITHSHYDHLDFHSVCEIRKKYGDHINWLVPMGLKKWMVTKVKVSDDKVKGK